ncbi:restriction endonuclease subunit S [Saccharomonospora halophila]|uniref:restriction endonuclease subunit S n=1 Tax=Saccharomonospora halophila TaxID=129922 RepID=UPI00048B50C2|nr:restriction endonuclease subunit S [Saccharomonospora halophila]
MGETLGALLAATGGSIRTGPFGTVLSAAEYTTHGVPVISVGELDHGTIRLRATTPRVDPDTTERLAEYLLRPGDLVLGRKGAVDRSAWVRPEEDGYFLGSDGIRVRFGDGDGVLSRFMAYQFRSPAVREWLLRNAAGTTMLSLNERVLRQLPVTVPGPGAQRAIAEVLGALDDKIANNDRIVLVTDRLCAADTAKASAESGTPRPLRDVATFVYGRALPAAKRIPGPVPVYGSGGLCGHHSAALVDRPGIVVGRKGTVGAVHWADGPHFPIDTTYSVRSVRQGTEEVLYYLLRTVRLGALDSDSAVPGLNREEAYRQTVRVPDDDGLASLSTILRQRFALLRSVRAESRTLARTRDELLPPLLSGRIRVRDAERTVAEAL